MALERKKEKKMAFCHFNVKNDKKKTALGKWKFHTKFQAKKKAYTHIYKID